MNPIENNAYTIKDGFFCSKFTSPIVTKEFTKEEGSDRIIIHPSGDTLLRLWADKDFEFRINTYLFKSENCEVKLFEGGLPHIGQFQNCIVIYDQLDKVYTEYENYDDINREILGCFRSTYAVSRGVKLMGDDYVFIIDGVSDPGHSENTLYKLGAVSDPSVLKNQR